jgi:hypothetical protein
VDLLLDWQGCNPMIVTHCMPRCQCAQSELRPNSIPWSWQLQVAVQRWHLYNGEWVASWLSDAVYI